MFEWIVMGFFIGVPLLLLIGGLLAMLYRQREDFSLEDLDGSSPEAGGGSRA